LPVARISNGYGPVNDTVTPVSTTNVVALITAIPPTIDTPGLAGPSAPSLVKW
jgi:hypothetical protein